LLLFTLLDGGAGQKIIKERVTGNKVVPMAKFLSSTCGRAERKALNVAEHLKLKRFII